ncbi:hypothetical protein CpipJ_CPIJ000508, partial [Culex quinquefasciatus]
AAPHESLKRATIHHRTRATRQLRETVESASERASKPENLHVSWTVPTTHTAYNQFDVKEFSHRNLSVLSTASAHCGSETTTLFGTRSSPEER